MNVTNKGNIPQITFKNGKLHYQKLTNGKRISITKPDGSVIWVVIHTQMARLDQEEDTISESYIVVISFMDITEQIDDEEIIEFHVETFAHLHDTTVKLIQEPNPQELAVDICKNCVETYGCDIAWIGKTNPDGSIKLITQYPEDVIELKQIDIRWDDSPKGNGAIGKSIRGQQPYVICNAQENKLFIPWKDFAEKYDFNAVGAFPMTLAGKTLGILVLYSQNGSFFTEERIKLFEVLGNFAAAALQKKALLKQTNRQLQQLHSLRRIDTSISSSFDLETILTSLLNEVINELKVDAVDILLLNSLMNTLDYKVGRGFHTDIIEQSRVPLGNETEATSILQKKSIRIEDLAESGNDFSRKDLIAMEEFVSYFGVPIISKGISVGILEVFTHRKFFPDEEWRNFLETLSGQASIAIEHLSFYESLQKSNFELKLAYDQTIEGWSRALDLRDKNTEGHTIRVTEMALNLARFAGISDDRLIHIRRGALLHDVGKMGIPDQILRKPSPLTDDDWMIMKRHPVYARDLLTSIEFLKPAIAIPYCHHEKWDGTGYPQGLKGQQIPLSARIFSLIDVWDALTSDRPYRPAMSRDQAISIMHEQVGKNFDPEISRLFFETIP